MKIGTKYMVDVTADIDLNDIEELEFIFEQGAAYKKFTYPSETAYLLDDGKTIRLIWERKDTWKFKAGAVNMDTRITLKNSDCNPETEIMTLEMMPTLFERRDDK